MLLSPRLNCFIVIELGNKKGQIHVTIGITMSRIPSVKKWREETFTRYKWISSPKYLLDISITENLWWKNMWVKYWIMHAPTTSKNSFWLQITNVEWYSYIRSWRMSLLEFSPNAYLPFPGRDHITTQLPCLKKLFFR